MDRYTVEYLMTRCSIDDCWTWLGKTCNGYATVVPRINGQKKYIRVHRMIYEMCVGQIPEGYVIDHLCNNTRCINPKHLDPKTIFDNAARGHHQSAINKGKTSCKRGHEFNEENTYNAPNGTRHCRACKPIYYKKRRENATELHNFRLQTR